MLPLYGIGRTFSTHDGFVKIGCWRWHKKKPPEGAQSADKVRGAGAFPVAQSRALPDGRAHGFAAPLRVALGLRPKCPQGTRFPSRLPGFGAEPQSLMPQHFPRALRASEGRKKRGFLQIQGFFNGMPRVLQGRGAQTVDKPKSTVIFHKEKRIIMSNI